MKKIYLLLMLILVSDVIALEKITDYVNDEAGIIDDNYKILITNELTDLKQNTSVEMAVATINSLNGRSIEDYSLILADKTLGETGKDNGILILIALQEREYRIEVGYGLEGILNDAKVGRIGREFMAPNFKTGNYQDGILKGVKEIKRIIESNSINETSATKQQSPNLTFIIIFIIGIILIKIISYYARKVSNENNPLKDNDFRAARNASILFGGGFNRGGGGFGGGSFGGGGAGGRF